MRQASLSLLAIAAIAAEEQLPPPSSASTDDETIVVTADRQANTLASTTASVTVLDGDQQRRDGHPASWVERLRRVPGVDLLTRNGGLDNGGFPGLRLRGTQKDSDTQVLVDGIPWNDPTATEGQPSLLALQPAAISRIEVVRGAQSGLYGSRSVGGVVNLRSAEPTAEHHGQVRLEGGSFRTLSTDASASGPLVAGDGRPLLGYSAGVSALDSDGFSTLTTAADGDPGDHEDDGLRRLGANGRLVFAPTTGVSLYAAGWMGSAVHASDETGPEDILPEKRERLWRAASGGSVALPGDSTLAADAAWTRSSRDNDSNFGNSTFDGEEQYGSVRWSYPIERLTLTPGIDLQRQTADTATAGVPVIDDRSQRTIGVWLQALVEGDSWETSASARHDRHSGAGDATTWRLGGAWLPWDAQCKIHAAVGTAFRAPSLDERYSFYDFGFGFGFAGNPDLEPQTSLSGECGLSVAAIEGLVIEATVFATRFENRIVYVSGSPPAFDTLENEDETSRLIGVESGISWAISTTPVELFATYTWQRTRDQDGNRFIGLPTHKGSVGATASGARGWATIAADGVGERDDANQAPLPGYVTASAVLGWQATPSLSLYVRGENLLDQTHTDARGFATGTYFTSAPRSVFLGAQATY